MITIRFSGRRPSPEQITMGQETDSGAERIRFLLPQIGENQIATLQMILPDGTPEAMLIEDNMITVPARLAEMAGRSRAWVEILADGVAWHSELFYLDVGELPPISERTEQEYPTVFQEAIARSEASKRAAEIAAAIAKSAQGQVTVEISADGDLIVTYEDTEGETHEANLGPVSAYAVAKKYGYQGTEQEWEEAIASVGEKADAAEQSAEDAADAALSAVTERIAAQTAKTAAEAAQTAAETAAARDVTAWLDAHAGTAQEIAVIDDTLTIAGAAAESQAVGEAVQKALRYMGMVRANDYDNLLSNIAAQGMYYISKYNAAGDAGAYSDRPVGSAGSAAVLLAYPVSASFVLQNLIDVSGGSYFRYITVSDHSVYTTAALNADANGWYLPKPIKELQGDVSQISQGMDTLSAAVEENTEAAAENAAEIQKALLYKKTAKATDYNNLLRNIASQGMYYLSQQDTASGAGAFTDRPVGSSGEAAILLAYPVSTTFVLQNLIDVSGGSYFRYIKVSDQSIYTKTAMNADANGWYIPNRIKGMQADIAALQTRTQVLEARQRWAGKKIVFFGDSRTWYDGQTYADDNTIKTDWRGETCVGYQQQCVNLLGITAVNEGVSGQTSAQICNRIRGYDFTGVDAVFLEGGVNDYIRRVAANVQIGQIAPIGGDTETYPDTGFDTGTVYGAWQSAIEYICNNYPQVKIFMDIPAIAWNGNGVFPYSTASIKGEIAELYNIPCLNLYKEAGINELNRAYYYVDNPDYGTRQWRLHFNNYGNAHVGQIIAEFINTH